MNTISKSFNEKIDKLQKASSEQLSAINRLKSENELLKLKESKMKLAIENLLARTEMELDEIEGLKEEVEEREKMENDNASGIENLEKNIAQKDREIFKKQLKIDFIKLQLEWFAELHHICHFWPVMIITQIKSPTKFR